MGLDMYLTGKRYIWGEYSDKPEEAEIKHDRLRFL